MWVRGVWWVQLGGREGGREVGKEAREARRLQRKAWGGLREERCGSESESTPGLGVTCRAGGLRIIVAAIGLAHTYISGMSYALRSSVSQTRHACAHIVKVADGVCTTDGQGCHSCSACHRTCFCPGGWVHARVNGAHTGIIHDQLSSTVTLTVVYLVMSCLNRQQSLRAWRQGRRDEGCPFARAWQAHASQCVSSGLPGCLRGSVGW